MTVTIAISKSEFFDRIRRFDSCNLDYDQAGALYDFIEDMIDQEIIGPDVCIGDWAILTSAYTLDEINAEHDRDFQDWYEVADAVCYDFLDNCYTDVIPVDDTTAVMVRL